MRSGEEYHIPQESNKKKVEDQEIKDGGGEKTPINRLGDILERSRDPYQKGDKDDEENEFFCT
jgi:hypothetical protein